MLLKTVTILLCALFALSAAERLSVGSRRPNDRLLYARQASSLPTDIETKHELTIDEKNVKVTYVEFDVYPVSIIRKIRVFIAHKSWTQLSTLPYAF